MYDSAGSVKHCVVRNNIIHGNGLRSGSGPGIIVCQGGNLICNNTCYGNGGHGIFVYNVPAGDPPNQICNNVLHGNGRAGIALENSPRTIVKNNICLDNKQHSLFAVGSAGALLDYNCYFPDGDGRFMWTGETPQRGAVQGKGRGQVAPARGTAAGRGEAGDIEGRAGKSLSFAEYKAHAGQDAHSICRDPGFVNAQARDYRLRADSPCVDAGTTVEVGVDFDGNKRPQGRGFDMGAYER
jgi:parallel beta-helix repeat protein